MPKKKATTETPDDSILVGAAKAIGHAAGKIALFAGAVKPKKIGKLTKKNKTGPPRREKKALKKRSK